MPNYDEQNISALSELNILEEKIQVLLEELSRLKSENQKIRTELEEGSSIETMLDQKKRQQLREKIEDMLEQLEVF